MKRQLLHSLAPVLALCPASAVSADDALANERPPMSRAALEQHWGVDCAQLAAALGAWSTQAARAPDEAWPRQLELCAAIHNPPGEPASAHCPDYARAGRLLAGGNDTRTEMKTLVLCEP